MMSYFRITITLKNKVVQGIRELEQEDIDIAWQVFYCSAVEVYSAAKILSFEVVKISTFSDDYRQWRLLKEKKQVNNRKDGRHSRKITLGEMAKRKNP